MHASIQVSLMREVYWLQLDSQDVGTNLPQSRALYVT